MNIIGKSHAKIILMGEHCVVYGKPALAVPISSVNLTAQLTKATSGQTIQCKYFIGDLSQAPADLLGIKRLIQSVLQSFHQQNTPFLLKINSSIPSERGMGSSAATAIAVTRALYQFFQKPLTHAKLLEVSNIEEKITHGNPSGIDTATASSNLPVRFIPGKPIEHLPINLKGDLIIADSGIKGRTDIAVNSVHEKYVHQPKLGKPAIDQLGVLARKAEYNLVHNQPQALGQAMNHAQKELALLGVSTPALDKLIQVARQHGAYGAKLTGSGLGGCVIALAPDNKAKNVAQAFLNQGAVNTYIEHFKTQGGVQ